MLLDIGVRKRANHVDFQMVVPRILECRLRQHARNTAPAQLRRNFGMPESDPPLTIQIEFEIRGFAFFLELEPVPRNLRRVVTHQLNKNSLVRNSFTESRSLAAFSNSNFFAASRISVSSLAI